MGKNQKRKGKLPAIFELEIAALRKGPVLLKRGIPLDWLADELQSCEYETTPQSAHVNLNLAPVGNGVLVKGSVHVEAKTACAVCLAETTLELSPLVSAFLVPKPDIQADPGDQELTASDLEQEWFEGDTVILDSLLRDTIMLALPMNPKCGDLCPGLAKYATDHPEPATDPRLAPLASLVIEKEK